MGAVDVTIWNQLKKGQGETNVRLDALIAEQRTTNQWLSRIVGLLERQNVMGGGYWSEPPTPEQAPMPAGPWPPVQRT